MLTPHLVLLRGPAGEELARQREHAPPPRRPGISSAGPQVTQHPDSRRGQHFYVCFYAVTARDRLFETVIFGIGLTRLRSFVIAVRCFICILFT